MFLDIEGITGCHIKEEAIVEEAVYHISINPTLILEADDEDKTNQAKIGKNNTKSYKLRLHLT